MGCGRPSLPPASVRCRGGLIAAALLFLVLMAPGSARSEDPPPPGLGDQLQSLSTAQGFRVRGLQHVTGEAERPVARDLATVEVLRLILNGYDYFVVNEPEGRIAEVRILGRSQEVDHGAPPQRVAVRSVRRGGHHDVVASLAGPNEVLHEISLTLDTGATTVVLPSSMMASLGYRPDMLRLGWADTAGGAVKIWSGELSVLSVGGAEVENVAVSFIDDNSLGAKGLLGMSFLRRFRLVIDDEANEIVFVAR